jgi:hypothetical protein
MTVVFYFGFWEQGGRFVFAALLKILISLYEPLGVCQEVNSRISKCSGGR